MKEQRSILAERLLTTNIRSHAGLPSTPLVDFTEINLPRLDDTDMLLISCVYIIDGLVYVRIYIHVYIIMFYNAILFLLNLPFNFVFEDLVSFVGSVYNCHGQYLHSTLCFMYYV